MNENENQYVKEDPAEPKFFSMIPNKVVDDLGYAELALYVYYKRVAADQGRCWKSVKQVAEDLKMSIPKLWKTQAALVDAGLISVSKRTNEQGIECNSKVVSIVNVWQENNEKYMLPPLRFRRTPPTKSYDKEKPIRKTNEEKDISPTGETDPEPQNPEPLTDIILFCQICGNYELHKDEKQVGCNICNGADRYEKPLTVEEADNKMFGTRDEPIMPNDELLRPTFTTDQMKQLATAYVTGKCPVGEHNRELCEVLEKQGYFKVRGRGKNGVTTYKLSDKGKAVCSDPTRSLADMIQLKQEIATRKAEQKSKPKPPKKKNGKAPQDITTMPEIQGIAEKLCLIHFGTTYKELTDDNKRTIVSLSHIYRNQGADSPQKVQQVHDFCKRFDWYEDASPYGFTKNMWIAKALNSSNGQPQAVDKTFSIEEVD